MSLISVHFFVLVCREKFVTVANDLFREIYTAACF